jgi:uncharacterized protein (TIGR03067 family)
MTRTWTLAWLLFPMVTLAPAAPRLKEKEPTVPPLFGEWLRVDHIQAGTPVAPDREPHHQVFKADGEWQYTYGNRPDGTKGKNFTVDLKQNPPTIDISLNVGKAHYRGVYKVEGDTLTLCLVTGDTERPKNFASTADQPTTVWVFKKVKAKE